MNTYSGSKLAGVSQVLLELLSLLEGDVGDGSHGQAVLETVDEAVRHRSDRRVLDGQREGGNPGDAGHELGPEVSLGDVEDGRVEDGAGVVNLLDDQTVGEGGDVQHVEESGLGHADPLAGLDQVDVLNDFNGTLGDLGGDVQRLEEGGLLGTEAGVLGRDSDVQGSESSGPSGGTDLVGQEHVSDAHEVLLGEDEADVALDVVQELLELRVVAEVAPDGLPHHGVLAHENGGVAPVERKNIVTGFLIKRRP